MATSPPTTTVRDLRDTEVPTAVALLARSMRDNPVNVAVFGDDPARRERCLQRLFSATLDVLDAQPRLCAVSEGRIAAVAVIAGPRQCQPTTVQKARIASRLAALGPRTLARIMAWQRLWSTHDPHRPHGHPGPLAVRPDVQGRGIGSLLLRDYTRQLDAQWLPAHLETDKASNVALYERHGFVVTARATVLGSPTWFMDREPRPIGDESIATDHEPARRRFGPHADLDLTQRLVWDDRTGDAR